MRTTERIELRDGYAIQLYDTGYKKLVGPEKINTKEHGVQTNRDFVISFLRDGWLPRIDQWGSASKPKTECRLYLDGGHAYSFKVSKTEYSFAIYLSEHPDYLKSGREN